MLANLKPLLEATGANKINFSLDILTPNKVRAIIHVNCTDKAKDAELAEGLKYPIVVEGSLADLDMMLVNAIMNIDLTPPAKVTPTQSQATATNTVCASDINDDNDSDIDPVIALDEPNGSASVSDNDDDDDDDIDCL